MAVPSSWQSTERPWHIFRQALSAAIEYSRVRRRALTEVIE